MVGGGCGEDPGAPQELAARERWRRHRPHYVTCVCTPAGVGAQTPVGVEAIQWGLPSAGYDPGGADGLYQWGRAGRAVDYESAAAVQGMA